MNEPLDPPPSSTQVPPTKFTFGTVADETLSARLGSAWPPEDAQYAGNADLRELVAKQFAELAQVVFFDEQTSNARPQGHFRRWDGRAWIQYHWADMTRDLRTVFGSYAKNECRAQNIRNDLAVHQAITGEKFDQCEGYRLLTRDKVIELAVTDDRQVEYVPRDHVKTDWNTGHLEANLAPEDEIHIPRWQKYLDAVMPHKDGQKRLQDTAGYLICQGLDRSVFFCLTGPGGTGKTTFVEVLRRIIGPKRCSSQSPRAMGTEFGLEPLLGKWVNFSDEVSYMGPKVESMIKDVTGSGKGVQINPKGRPSFTADLFVKFVFISNDLPPFADRTNALWDRLVLTPFDVKLADTGIPMLGSANEAAEYLLAERDGILSWAFEGLRRVLASRGSRKDAFTPYHRAQEVTQDHKVASDPVLQWINEQLQVQSAEGNIVTVDGAYNEFRLWLMENGYKTRGKHSFVQGFSRIMTEKLGKVDWEARRTRKRQRLPNGTNARKRAWKGFEVTGDDNEDADGQTHNTAAAKHDDAGAEDNKAEYAKPKNAKPKNAKNNDAGTEDAGDTGAPSNNQ